MHEGVLFRKNNFRRNDICENLDNFPLYGFCICIDSAFMGQSTPITQLLMKHIDTLSIQCRLNICMKEFIIFVEIRHLFPYMAFVYAWIVPLWANQLLLQLLMEQFDTLPIHCRHIEHMHEGVYNFCLHRFY